MHLNTFIKPVADQEYCQGNITSQSIRGPNEGGDKTQTIPGCPPAIYNDWLRLKPIIQIDGGEMQASSYSFHTLIRDNIETSNRLADLLNHARFPKKWTAFP